MFTRHKRTVFALVCDVKLSEDLRNDVMSGRLDTYQSLTSKLSDAEDGQPKHGFSSGAILKQIEFGEQFKPIQEETEIGGEGKTYRRKKE